jgi:HK97 family phage major capsid protein
MAGAVIVRKGDDDDPVSLVTKAIDDLQKAVDDRLKKLEEKGAKAGDDKELKALQDRLADLEKKSNRPDGLGDKKEPSAERKAFGNYLRQGNQISEEDRKALNESSDAQGGYLVPPEFSTEILRDLVEYSPMRQVASIRNTGAPAVIYPVRTGETNARWVGEMETRPESTIGFGQKEIEAKELATYVELSNRLMQDAPQAETEVRLALAEDFGKKESTAFLWGQGGLEPEGLMLNPDIPEALNGHAADLSAEAMIALMYGMPQQYRNRGAWAMNGTTLGKLRSLKDGNGNFLWQPSFQVGQPETILGRPVVEFVDLEDPAANKFPIVYGDFSAYRILDRLAMSTLVDPYSRAVNGITRIHATRRVGGAVLDPKRFRKLKMATS